MANSESEVLEKLIGAVCAEPESTDSLALLVDHLEDRGDPCATYLRQQIALRSRRDEGEMDAALLRELRALYPGGVSALLGRLEQAGAIVSNLTGLPTAWWGQELPGRPRGGTYIRCSVSELPTLPIDEFDGSLRWLRDTPFAGGEAAGACEAKPWELLFSAMEDDGFVVPPALRTLMNSPDLQSLIPSATSNYFISAGPEDWETNLAGLQNIEEKIAFVPFYSDQQSCIRWGVWLDRRGESYAPVIAAGLDFGEDEDKVSYTNFEFCAQSLESFLYRTWIENRIWFATQYEPAHRTLLDIESAYLQDC